MSFERYTQIYKDKQGKTLKVRRGSKTFEFSIKKEKDKNYRAFITGETGLFYQWKNEPDNSAHYHSLTDALDTENADIAAYALRLSCKEPYDYVKRAYKRIMWKPKLSYIDMAPVPDFFRFGIFAKAENLKIEKDGYLRMRLAVRYKKKGISNEATILEPDFNYVIDIPEGTYSYTELCSDVTLPAEKVASVGVFIEGVRYSGKIFVERPYLESKDTEINLLPGFEVPVACKEHFLWTAQNLSRKEWPEFKVLLNGTKIFEGEIFERCHLDSEWEVGLPSHLLEEKNTLEIELVSDYINPLPYTIHELGIIEQAGGKWNIIAVSEAGVEGGSAYALIRTEAPKLTLKASYTDALSGNGEFYFEEPGLHGIRIVCNKACENSSFTLTDGTDTKIGFVKRIVQKQEDNVYTGTSDMVYIPMNEDDLEEYLCWYLSSGIGNMITSRPVYRWCGTRSLNPKAWEIFVRIANAWDMKYVNMSEGRELPGMACNPDDDMLAGNGYLGWQEHERDGAMFYWRRYYTSNKVTDKQRMDMYAVNYREDPLHSSDIHDNDNKIYVIATSDDEESESSAPTFEGDTAKEDICYNYKNPTLPKDMKIAYEDTVRSIGEQRGERVPRHTGPSVTFKYFLDAGFKWVGAETMYGTLEPIMSFIRGACRDRSLETFGVHHALQWSSAPHDAPEHARRYRLALYVSYMQGATDINTEEGLWRLEECYSRFHRFTDACVQHTKQQQDFYRYVSTHTRRGEFYTPMALIHGRYDGWHGFSSDSTWGWLDVVDTDADKSWQMLSVFYPEQNLGTCLYYHNCPTDRPMGFNSTTPIGNIDAIPIEARSNNFEKYRAIAFVGYNAYEKEDFAKLENYVMNGGKLLLTRAHMTKTTDYKDVLSGKLQYPEDAVFSFTKGAPEFAQKTVNGIKVEVAVNLAEGAEVISRCDDGTPLVVKYKVGKGEVTLFNANAYPAHPAIAELYKKALSSQMDEASKNEKVYASCETGMEFALYDRGDMTDVYFLAVDWYRDPALLRKASLRIGNECYKIELPFGVMIKCCVNDSVGVYPCSEDGEVIYVKNGEATVQGTGRVEFKILKSGKESSLTVDFSKDTVQTISI